MPVTAIHFHGDPKVPGSLRWDDLRFLASSKTYVKIKHAMRFFPAPAELHFVNLPKPVAHDHLHDGKIIGQLSPQIIKEYYKLEITEDPDAVKIVFVENEGSDRLPFTPWMVAHRTSHVFCQRNPVANRLWQSMVDTLEKVARLYEIIQDDMTHPLNCTIYDLPELIGTTRACVRDLARVGEWFHECFAQLCMTGEIRFRPAEKVLHFTKKVSKTSNRRSTIKPENKIGRFEAYYTLEQINYMLASTATNLVHGFSSIIQNSVGHIRVL